MPRATCRCGQILSIPVNGPERVICPKCQAKVRVRRDSPEATAGGTAAGGEGAFIRFDCPCGRRLKVRAAPGGELPQAGKCPDCGRIVPVPAQSTSSSSAMAMARSPADHESQTEEMDENDIAVLDRWSQGHEGLRGPAKPSPAANRAEVDLPKTDSALAPTGPVPILIPAKAEAGLRVCPRCGRPVHLSALACRECGSHVPKR